MVRYATGRDRGPRWRSYTCAYPVHVIAPQDGCRLTAAPAPSGSDYQRLRLPGGSGSRPWHWATGVALGLGPVTVARLCIAAPLEGALRLLRLRHCALRGSLRTRESAREHEGDEPHRAFRGEDLLRVRAVAPLELVALRRLARHWVSTRFAMGWVRNGVGWQPRTFLDKSITFSRTQGWVSLCTSAAMTRRSFAAWQPDFW